MRKFKCEVSLESLIEAADQLQYTVDGSGILMGHPMWSGLLGGIWLEAAMDIARCFERNEIQISWAKTWIPAHAMVNIILPGGDSGLHVDPEPPLPQPTDGYMGHFFRWHLPLVTNKDCWIEQDGEERAHLAQGFWHGPIRYWQPHRVVNAGTKPRTHLIIDLI